MDSQSEMSNFFLKSPVPMFVIDGRYLVQHINEKAYETLSLTPEEANGKSLGELFHCENLFNSEMKCGSSKKCAHCSMRELISLSFETLKGIDSEEVKLPIRNKHDSQLHWFLLSSNFFRDNEEKLIVSFQDITDQKEIEKELKSREKNYRSMFTSNHAVMLLIDPENGQIIEANKSAQDFYGWDYKVFKTKRIQHINTLTEKEVNEEILRAKAEQRNHFFFRHILSTGEIRDVEVYSGPVHYNGKLVLLSIIHDISDRKKAETELAMSEQTARALLNASTESAFLIDRYGTFLTLNEITAKRLKKSSYELIGSNAFDFLPEDTAIRRQKVLDEVLETGEPIRFVDERNGIIMDNHLYPIKDMEGEISKIAIFSNDITKEKEAEEERENLINELQTALAEIKTLSGLIPICAHCKKIRDDKGYWNNIESYIETHTEGQFSHGLCPQCADELYGNEKWYKKPKT